jgi:hypothetical protein
MPLAEQVALGERIDMLFRGDDDADAQRVQDFGPQGCNQTQTRGWLWDQLQREEDHIKELWRLLGLAVADTVSESQPSEEACRKEAENALRTFRQHNQRDVTETTASFLDIFKPLPGKCEACMRGYPCCQKLVLSTHRVTLAQLRGLDLILCGWSVPVIQYALKKRNLFRYSRSKEAFEALVRCKVWPADKVPTDQTALLPALRNLGRAALVELFMKVLEAESECCDDWDWESVGVDVETEVVDSADSGTVEAFAARGEDGREWEEAAYREWEAEEAHRSLPGE